MDIKPFDKSFETVIYQRRLYVLQVFKPLKLFLFLLQNTFLR